MKVIQSALALGALASVAFAPASFAFTCPERAPSAITAPATDAGRACQNAIAKAAMSFVKAQLKTDTKCMSAQVPGACPSLKDTQKKQKAATKARDAVVKACGGGALADLTNSYSAFSEPADVASCTLSQNNSDGRLIAYKVNGTPGVLRSEKNRDKCVKTLNAAGTKYALSIMQSINKCLASNIKAGNAGDLGPVCVGAINNMGQFVAPTDTKTADALAGALTKMRTSVDKTCTPVTALYRETIFACPGAETIDDFQGCLACGVWDNTLNILAAQYSETGTLVTPATDALQTAVDASGPNAKLLIKSGLYREDVSIVDNSQHEGTQFVGCGGASEDRPKVQPPTTGGPYLNGIFAANVDGLVFQSLDVSGGWDENGVFVTGADGVTFRDCVTDGGDGSSECIGGANDGAACSATSQCPSGVCSSGRSTYGIFPVESTNVLVETSSATNIRDAGIYVGSSHDVVMRYNTATHNVAGMELENSSNGLVHNNYAGGNVGGILVFKLPGPPVQAGNLHDMQFNVIDNNDTTPNWGKPGTSVAGIPPGTGVVILSTKDSEYHHNLVLGNNTYGMVAIDQQAFDALADGALGGEFSHSCEAPDAPYTKCNPANAAVECPLSMSCVLDQKMTNNKVYSNTGTDNGGLPNPGAVAPGDFVYAIIEEDLPGGNNNCFSNNSAVKKPLMNVTISCP